MRSAEYTRDHRVRLLEIARSAMTHGVSGGCPDEVSWPDLPRKLLELRATFVTLTQAGRLRGCTGSLEAVRPLAEDVARSAFLSSLRDPRFRPVAVSETDQLRIEISVLSPLRRIEAADEEQLLCQLIPGKDGLVIIEGERRATFLPQVWEKLPERRQFVRELKLKMGVPVAHWSEELTVYRYHTETFAEQAVTSESNL